MQIIICKEFTIVNPWLKPFYLYKNNKTMLTNHNHNSQHFFPFFRFKLYFYDALNIAYYRFKNWNLFEDNTTKCQFKANYCSVSIIDFQILTPYNCLFPSWHSFIFIGDWKVDSLKMLKHVPYCFGGYWQQTRYTQLKLIPSTLTLKASFKLICMIVYTGCQWDCIFRKILLHL